MYIITIAISGNMLGQGIASESMFSGYLSFLSNMKNKLNWLLIGCIGGGLLTAQSVFSGPIVFTAESAGVQSTTVPGAITENFNELPTGSISSYVSPIGTFSGGTIVAANKYGGAGGTGNYYAVGSESGTTEATLTFNSPQDYLGMWWSAGDGKNVLKFYSGSTLLATFTTATLISSGYLTSAYYGNPNSAFLGQDGTEPFDYLDFTGIGGQTFTSVEFDNTLTTGFEMDNLSVSSSVTTPPGNNFVPDASNTAWLFLIALTSLMGYRHFRSAAPGTTAAN